MLLKFPIGVVLLRHGKGIKMLKTEWLTTRRGFTFFYDEEGSIFCFKN